MALRRTQGKLALFGVVFFLLLAQNVFLVHHNKVAGQKIAELEVEVGRLRAELGPSIAESAEPDDLSNSSQSAR